jgi:hypothetical protein
MNVKTLAAFGVIAGLAFAPVAALAQTDTTTPAAPAAGDATATPAPAKHKAKHKAKHTAKKAAPAAPADEAPKS